MKETFDNLVTGGAGFIGSHLIDKLMNDGQTVVCLDNFLSGSAKNIEFWLNNPRFKLIEEDVISNIDLKVKKVWHLACPASPKIYLNDPIRTLKVCIDGTQNILELARKNGSQILLASSSEIYGNPLINPQNENYFGNVNSIGLRSCYSEGKRISEYLFNYYRFKYKLDIRIARIFNTYGPRLNSDDGRVISNFITSALNNKKLIIYGNGNQTRSFCYIDDLVKALIRLMNVKYYLPVNLGNPDELTIYELAIKILQKLDKQIDFISFREKNKDDPQLRKPEISLAKQILDWNPEVNLDFGLNKTIEYFKQPNTEIKNG